MLRIGWLTTLAVVALMVAGVTNASASLAGADDQFALTSGATVLYGQAGTATWDQMCGGTPSDNYEVQVVNPGSVVAASGPSGRPGEADLRQPWVSFVEQTESAPNGCDNALLDVHTLCAAFVNPSNYSQAIGSDASFQASFRVSGCNDGKGYDYYSVSFAGTVWAAGDTWVGALPSGWGPSEYGTWVDGYWHGTWDELVSAGTLPRDDLGQPGTTRYVWIDQVQVCGHDGLGLHCLSGNAAWGRTGVASFEATAHAP